jgi:tight adherence protein B
MFASIALLVRFGSESPLRWARERIRRDERLYESYVDELFLDWSPEKTRRAAFAANIGIVVVGVVIFMLSGLIVFALAAAVAAYFLPRLLYSVARNKRLNRFEQQLPDAINVMVSSVRAGRSLPQAIEDVARKMTGPVADEFGVMMREYSFSGMSVEGVLERARGRLKIESFSMIATALMINSQRGGDVLHMLERMSDAIRELSRLKKKLMTETSEVRAQEKIIMFMTPLFGLLVCLFDREIFSILFNTFLGNLIIVVVLSLQIFGFIWIRRIIRTTI